MPTAWHVACMCMCMCVCMCMCTACAPHVHRMCTAYTCMLACPAAAPPLPRRCPASGPPLPRHSPAAPARAALPTLAKFLTSVCTRGRYASVRRVVVLWAGGVDDNAAAPAGHVSTTTRVRRPTSGQLATSGECSRHPTRAQPAYPTRPTVPHSHPPPPLSSTHPRRLGAAPSASSKARETGPAPSLALTKKTAPAPTFTLPPPPPGRLRHWVSFRLTPEAPADAIVARLLALDALECVRTIHFGNNCSPEGKSRGHTHGARESPEPRAPSPEP